MKPPAAAAPGPASAPRAVAYFCPGWPPRAFPNGIVTYVEHLRRSLASLGVRSVVLARFVEGAVDPDEITDVHAALIPRTIMERVISAAAWKMRPVRWRDRIVPRAIADLVDRQREAGIELLEMEETFGWAATVVERSRMPVVVRLHGPTVDVGPMLGAPRDAAYRYQAERERRALVAAAAVSAPSQHVLDRVREAYHLDLPAAHVIPNAVTPVSAARRWSPESCDRDRILCVGRFDRRKGADTVLRAFAETARRRPGCRLTFVGPDRGLTTPDGRSWSVETFVREFLGDVGARVSFLGFQPAERIAELRREAAVTVVGSRYENFPMAVLEALAMGSPLVSTDVGGIPEIVRDGCNGLLCPADDHLEMADRLERLLEDLDLAAALGRQGALDIEERYHPRRIAQDTLAFYRQVLARAGTPES